MDYLEYGLYFLGFLAVVLSAKALTGLVIIDEKSVGIVTKKFSSKSLPMGRIIATNGESGIQAETLAPGIHFFLWPWQYSVQKEKFINIEPGHIGLVIARDGATVPQNRILADTVECNNFQDAAEFFKNGGQKGKQIGVLTTGVYRINTRLFEVEIAEVTKIDSGYIGIATTFEGVALEGNNIAGDVVEGHNGFQDPAAFIKNGGKRGLQEQVILAGQWNLNPWFVNIDIVKMTEIPVGFTGVVTSYVGKDHEDVSGEGFKHGDLVARGHKGVWDETLSNGLHPINTKTTKINQVPTTNVALNWATNRSEAHKLDQNLSSITVRSMDGFSYNLDVSVIIHIGAKKASRVISRMGSMENLISQVLEPAIANYFRNSAQAFSALDFLKKRNEMQTNAAKFVREALAEYDIEAVDTLIGDIVLPAQLLTTQTERKLAEEMKQTYAIQQDAQKQKEALNRQQALTEIQMKMVENEQQVKIAELTAQQKTNQAAGETKIAEQKAEQNIKLAESEAKAVKLRAEAEAERIEKVARAEAAGIEAKGAATASAYKAGVEAMGKENFTLLETMGVIGKEKVKVIPDLVVGGGQDNGGMGIFNAFMANMVKDQMKPNTTTKLN